MIISCPACKKKFEIGANLITSEGRNLQCGSCSKVWFYKFEQNVSNLRIQDTIKDFHEDVNKREILTDLNKDIPNKKKDNVGKQKDKALVKYEKKTKLNFFNFIGYFFVLILSFVALLIILDTFEPLLLTKFPNLELILFNFYETLLDIYLFIKDLIK